nr:MAG TPA: hypothetical protein [Caudoviricetes sp.]
MRKYIILSISKYRLKRINSTHKRQSPTKYTT